MKEQDELYGAYLTADLPRAREILRHKIQIDESQALLAEAGIRVEHDYFLDCSRLYVLERRSGNDDSAEAALIKARYWFLRSGESSQMPARQLAEEVRTFNAERILSMVDEQDRAKTAGKGPNYLGQLNPGKTGDGYSDKGVTH
jgi:hypothetical protein